MKKQYIAPQFEAQNIAVADVITMSAIDGEAKDVVLTYGGIKNGNYSE